MLELNNTQPKCRNAQQARCNSSLPDSSIILKFPHKHSGSWPRQREIQQAVYSSSSEGFVQTKLVFAVELFETTSHFGDFFNMEKLQAIFD